MYCYTTECFTMAVLFSTGDPPLWITIVKSRYVTLYIDYTIINDIFVRQTVVVFVGLV